MLNGLSALLVAASVATATVPVSDAVTNPISRSIPRVTAEISAAAPQPALPAPARWARPPQRGAGKIAAGAVLGAVAGIFAGGFVGYKLERAFGDCRCDDPGIRGVLVGVPVGALVGGIVGGKFLFR